MSMECEKCLQQTAVLDSRNHGGTRGGIVYRRRSCNSCGHRFTTYEIAYSALMQLVEAQKRLQFMREMFGQGLNSIATPEKKVQHKELIKFLPRSQTKTGE